MRHFSLLIGAAVACATVVLGSPTATATLTWFGEVFPGSGNVTLSGSDVIDIKNQILKLNPNFTSEAPPPYPSTAARDDNPTEGPYHCGDDWKIATADYNDELELMNQIWYVAGYWKVGANACRRLACAATTGLYWCNLNNWGVRTSGRRIYNQAIRPMNLCCQLSSQDSYHNAISGEAFWGDNDPEAAHTKVVIAYANCNLPVDIDPLSYDYPGPNDICEPRNANFIHSPRDVRAEALI